jgi:hypothetical protein
MHSLRILVLFILGVVASSGDDLPMASHLMSYSRLDHLASEYTDMWKTIRKDQDSKATPEQKSKSKELAEAVFAEHKLRQDFYAAIKEGNTIADYPGILEKLNILCEKAFAKEGSKNYNMFFLTSRLSDEGDPVLWITVDSSGKILSKGRTILAH